MSGILPDFESGDVLRAADLQELVGAVRAAAGGAAVAGGVRQAVRRQMGGRRYGFQLAELHGLLWVRQGFLDAGNGRFLPVGRREWNALGKFRPCTVWLEIDAEALRAAAGGADVEVAKVVLGDYGTAAEKNLRRRLGYVRPVGGDGFAMVQVLGGLVAPGAPRRQMGVRYDGTGPVVEEFRRCDAALMFRHAGAVTGSGYSVTVGESEEEVPPARVSLHWGCEMEELLLPDEDGGNFFGLLMEFD